jgi:lysophospholipid acyltransferase (LPLAT)-like uncharacterized protein
MKRFLFKYLFPEIIVIILKILHFTYRIKIVDNTGLNDKIGKKPIYIVWHQRFFPAVIPLSKRKPIAAIVSKSKDGDLAAGVIRRLGWLSVRGSSSSGGAIALKQINRLCKQGYSAGHVVDGPRGPFGEVKPGLILLAKITGMPVVPMIISPEKKWQFGSWDKFIIPKPFSRIILKYESEIYIPQSVTRQDIGSIQSSLRDLLFKSHNELDQTWNK